MPDDPRKKTKNSDKNKLDKSTNDEILREAARSDIDTTKLQRALVEEDLRAKDEAVGDAEYAATRSWAAKRNADKAAKIEADNAAQEAKTFDLSGGTGVTVTLPDGTVVEVSGQDFEDSKGTSRWGVDSIKRALDKIGPWGAGLTALGFLALLLFVLNNGKVDTQTADAAPLQLQEQGSEPAEESSEAPVAGPEEPLSATEQVQADEVLMAEFVECPPDTVWDNLGIRPSPKNGEESPERPETPPETLIAKAFAVDCSGFGVGSYVFTLIVRGDAETVFAQDGTTIDLRFIVNNTWPDNLFEDDTGFTVFVDYNRQFEEYVGWVTDADHSPIGDATVEIVWLEPTTLEATVKIPGEQVDVRKVRTELLGLIEDEQEVTTDKYLDVAIWTAEPGGPG